MEVNEEKIEQEVVVQLQKLDLKCDGTEILVVRSLGMSERYVAAIRKALQRNLKPDAKIAVMCVDSDSDVKLIKLNEGDGSST